MRADENLHDAQSQVKDVIVILESCIVLLEQKAGLRLLWQHWQQQNIQQELSKNVVRNLDELP